MLMCIIMLIIFLCWESIKENETMGIFGQIFVITYKYTNIQICFLKEQQCT